MSFDVVRYEVRDRVAVVTMNRPDVRNAQNSAMTYALDDAFYRAAEELMGMRAGMDAAFGLHHLAYAPNAEVGGDSLGGQDTKTMAERNR